MVKSIIYWHPWIYRSAMKLVYGKEYSKRYLVIAKEAGNMDVLDVCCGDCRLSNYVMQDSLYQFIPKHEKIIKKLLKQSKKVIIAEAGITFGQSKNPIISAIAKKLTSTSRQHKERFTKRELYKLYKKFNAKKIIDTGKDLTAVFE